MPMSMKDVKFPTPETIFECGGRNYLIQKVHMFLPNEGYLLCEGRLPGVPDKVEYVVFNFNLLPHFDVFGRNSYFDEVKAFADFKCRCLF